MAPTKDDGRVDIDKQKKEEKFITFELFDFVLLMLMGLCEQFHRVENGKWLVSMRHKTWLRLTNGVH